MRVCAKEREGRDDESVRERESVCERERVYCLWCHTFTLVAFSV